MDYIVSASEFSKDGVLLKECMVIYHFVFLVNFPFQGESPVDEFVFRYSGW